MSHFSLWGRRLRGSLYLPFDEGRLPGAAKLRTAACLLSGEGGSGCCALAGCVCPLYARCRASTTARSVSMLKPSTVSWRRPVVPSTLPFSTMKR